MQSSLTVGIDLNTFLSPATVKNLTLTGLTTKQLIVMGFEIFSSVRDMRELKWLLNDHAFKFKISGETGYLGDELRVSLIFITDFLINLYSVTTTQFLPTPEQRRYYFGKGYGPKISVVGNPRPNIFLVEIKHRVPVHDLNFFHTPLISRYPQ